VILTPIGIKVEKTMQYIKGGFSYRVRKELGLNSEIWERGYVEHSIRDGSDYRKHAEYIHQNPVKAGMVATTEEYPYSSARAEFDLDDCPQGLKPHVPWIA